MSASSESRGSAARVRDVIDLDRYMRSVRPSRHRPVHTRERLIVDAGGVDRLPVHVISSSSGPLPPRATDHSKRYSHDSGVSDGSYLRQRHRPYRRLSENKRESSRTAGSNSSVREFKAACEKALREQQEQIARVTELCQKLAQPQISQNVVNDTKNIKNFEEKVYPENSPQFAQNNNQIGEYSPDLKQNYKNAKKNFGQNVSEVNRVNRPFSPGTSDTSSSFSSRGIRMRDRHRSDSCKTYQLIMGKLDELSHLFANRHLSAKGRGSSASVLVCDKLVATDDGKNNSAVIQVIHASRFSDRNHLNTMKYSDRSQFETQRANITPMGTNYVPVEGGQGNYNVGSAGDVFDLENPLQPYAQAKRLQALHASQPDDLKQSEDLSRNKSQDSKLDSSLCALCRVYWRLVRRFFKQQIFGSCT